MKFCRTVVCIAVFAGLLGVENGLVASQQEIAVADDNASGGRKNVTIYARNATSASSKALAQNPGWSVVSVTKVNSDPKSMAYRVVMKK